MNPAKNLALVASKGLVAVTNTLPKRVLVTSLGAQLLKGLVAA